MIVFEYETQFPSSTTVILKVGCVSAPLEERIRNPEAQACQNQKGQGPLYFCHVLHVIWIHTQV